MKKIAFILAIVLFGTSVHAGSMVKSLYSTVFSHLVSDTCCSKGLTGDMDSCDGKTSEKEGCCKGGECDCKCCTHLSLMSLSVLPKCFMIDFPKVSHTFSSYYQGDFIFSIFIPPAV